MDFGARPSSRCVYFFSLVCYGSDVWIFLPCNFFESPNFALPTLQTTAGPLHKAYIGVFISDNSYSIHLFYWMYRVTLFIFFFQSLQPPQFLARLTLPPSRVQLFPPSKLLLRFRQGRQHWPPLSHPRQPVRRASCPTKRKLTCPPSHPHRSRWKHRGGPRSWSYSNLRRSSACRGSSSRCRYDWKRPLKHFLLYPKRSIWLIECAIKHLYTYFDDIMKGRHWVNIFKIKAKPDFLRTISDICCVVAAGVGSAADPAGWRRPATAHQTAASYSDTTDWVILSSGRTGKTFTNCDLMLGLSKIDWIIET